MNPAERKRFDHLFEQVLEALPIIHPLLDEIPVILEDRPAGGLLRALQDEGLVGPDAPPDELCGLHTGVMLTERSVEDHAVLPDQVHLFREGIVAIAGGWEEGDDNVAEQIRITLLHEFGHHFGLDEDGLDDLGYA